MHRLRAKVNPAGPFDAAEIRIDGDSVENPRIQQFQKHSATPFRFNWENAADAVVESNFQPAVRKGLSGNDPNHTANLIQERDFGRLLVSELSVAGPRDESQKQMEAGISATVSVILARI